MAECNVEWFSMFGRFWFPSYNFARGRVGYGNGGGLKSGGSGLWIDWGVWTGLRAWATIFGDRGGLYPVTEVFFIFSE